MSNIPVDPPPVTDLERTSALPTAAAPTLHVSPPPPSRRTFPGPSATAQPPRWETVSLSVQLALSLTLVAGVLAYLLWLAPQAPPAATGKRPATTDPVVQVVGPDLLSIRSGTPLDSQLEIGTVNAQIVRSPVLTVSGRTLASLRTGDDDASDGWQFATGELLTAFTDWERALADVEFLEEQLASVRELAQARVEAQQKVVAQMEKLVAAGTDTPKDLAAERNTLIQYQIEGRREIREAETAVRLARRTEATLARQLQQAGLEPTVLRAKLRQGDDLDIVVAEVPEAKAALVKMQMTCEVRFFALPGRVFTGKVSAISPVISSEKRILLVQFTVKDTDHLIRPGMFAEVGLGTDERTMLLMPADGVLHLARHDYALVAAGPGRWRVVAIRVGVPMGKQVEVLEGLQQGERVLGKGAILLKPLVSQALAQRAASPTADAVPGEQP